MAVAMPDDWHRKVDRLLERVRQEEANEAALLRPPQRQRAVLVAAIGALGEFIERLQERERVSELESSERSAGASSKSSGDA